MIFEKCCTCKHSFTTGKDRLYCKKALADKDDCGEYEMLDKEIETLEQEPCGDCISREAVMDIVKRWYPYKAELEQLKALPSVTPAPRMGHWIMHLDDLFPMESTMECDQCHKHQPLTIDDNYCPACGCRMEVENEVD